MDRRLDEPIAKTAAGIPILHRHSLPWNRKQISTTRRNDRGERGSTFRSRLKIEHASVNPNRAGYADSKSVCTSVTNSAGALHQEEARRDSRLLLAHGNLVCYDFSGGRIQHIRTVVAGIIEVKHAVQRARERIEGAGYALIVEPVVLDEPQDRALIGEEWSTSSALRTARSPAEASLK
jgi:hypothetical protein